MICINRTVLMGNVGKDPMTKESIGGLVTFFSLATNHKFTTPNGDVCTETSWHNIVCFAKSGEIARKVVKSGDIVFVEGRIKNRDFTDSMGVKRTKTEVIADRICLVSPRLEKTLTERPTSLTDVVNTDPTWT